MAKKISKKIARRKTKSSKKEMRKKNYVGYKPSKIKTGTFWFVYLVLLIVFIYGVYLLLTDFTRTIDGIGLILASALIFLVIKLVRKLIKI
ncbi:MAG: hypothetical protein WC533_00615 [Candidatus Pacearchaeota archaeon]